MEYLDLLRQEDAINELLARYGVKFGIYKNNTFHEQLFPFDAIARIITKKSFTYLSKGLIQRVDALNAFIDDVYTNKSIIKDKIIPEDFIYNSPGYLKECEGIVPIKKIHSHISGIDLVEGKDDEWYILEDNLRVPSGASYPMIARDFERKCLPKTFNDLHIVDNRNYAQLLKEVMDSVNNGGLNCIMTPGRYNAAYFEHSYLAEKTGSVLVTGSELEVENDVLYFKNYNGKREKVGALYRRISDDFLDPLTFRPDSLIGIPHVFECYRKHNLGLINAPGNGVADDKGIYYFVPKMIKYYLNEEPILKNAPTYLPFYEDDMKYTLEHFDSLVLKDVAEAGGYGVVFGSKLSKAEKENFISLLKAEPRRFIAQEVIDFKDIDIAEGDEIVPRKADLRAFVLSSGTTKVWESGLTRFSRKADSFIVNSSQGGGFKDTWVLSL